MLARVPSASVKTKLGEIALEILNKHISISTSRIYSRFYGGKVDVEFGIGDLLYIVSDGRLQRRWRRLFLRSLFTLTVFRSFSPISITKRQLPSTLHRPMTLIGRQ